eukprot:SAG31_NODE_7777_length_1599_cov_1.472667_2_plen_121_part_00
MILPWDATEISASNRLALAARVAECTVATADTRASGGTTPRKWDVERVDSSAHDAAGFSVVLKPAGGASLAGGRGIAFLDSWKGVMDRVRAEAAIARQPLPCARGVVPKRKIDEIVEWKG